MERTSSKGYSPSVVAPSLRSTHSSSRNDVPRGSDGERGISDSDRKKGKDKSRDVIPEDRERGFGPSGGAATPTERARSVSTTYGTPAIAVAKVPSTNSNDAIQGEMLSSNWALPAGSVPSRSPSVKPPHSRSPSVHGGAVAQQTPPQEFSVIPPSAASDHRQSHLWDSPSAAMQPPAAEDRPRSPFVAKPYSPAPAAADLVHSRPPSAFGGDAAYGKPASVYGDASQSRPRSPYAPSLADRPKSPFILDPPSAIGRSVSPFVDRPKSGIEGSFFSDRPKSAFGDAPPMFGDAGPAADIGQGAGTPLFDDPPASVFGETGAAGGAFDSWGAPAVASPAPSAKSGKSKRKGSAAATPSMPASGLASRASPAISAHKSPFGKTQDGGLFDEPVVAAAAVAASPALGSPGGLWGSKAPSPAKDKERGMSPLNPAAQFSDEPVTSGGGLWGSKAPSPMDKSRGLSPLNPSAQIHDSPAPPPVDSWGFDTNQGDTNQGGEGDTWGSKGGDSWGGGDTVQASETKALSPVVPVVETPVAETPVAETPVAETPVAETPVDETPKETAAGGKKKKGKKGTAAAAKAAQEEEKAAAEKAEADRKAQEAQADADRIAAEKLAEETRRAEEDRREAERKEEERKKEERKEEERKEEERKAEEEKAEKDKQEADRLAQEEADKLKEEDKLNKELDELEAKQAADELAEKERKEKEEKEQAAAPVSLFGNSASIFSGGHLSSSSLNPPDQLWVSTDTGGGDDSWGSSWGAPLSASGKKKKGKGGSTPTSALKTSAFGFGRQQLVGPVWGVSGRRHARRRCSSFAQAGSHRFANIDRHLP